jgi:hypothetical protein
VSKAGKGSHPCKSVPQSGSILRNLFSSCTVSTPGVGPCRAVTSGAAGCPGSCSAKARLALIKRQLRDIDAEIQTRIGAETPRARAFEIMRSIPGLGAVSTAAVLIECPGIGTMNRKQVASLAGLAPMTRQSGHWNGQAFIQGGRQHLRAAL